MTVAVTEGVGVNVGDGVDEKVGVTDGVGEELGLGLAMAYTVPSLTPTNSVDAAPIAGELHANEDVVKFHCTEPLLFTQTTLLSAEPT